LFKNQGFFQKEIDPHASLYGLEEEKSIVNMAIDFPWVIYILTHAEEAFLETSETLDVT